MALSEEIEYDKDLSGAGWCRAVPHTLERIWCYECLSV